MTPEQSLTAMKSAATQDLLSNFNAFFDQTVDEVYAHILRNVRTRSRAEDVVRDVYFSLLQGRRFFWWRKNIMEESALLSLADKAIRSLGAWERRTDIAVGRPPPLLATEKAEIRAAVLERFLAARLSNLRFVMPVALFLVIAGGFVGSVLSVSPRSLEASLTQIAAAEVLLMEEDIVSLRTLAALETDLQRIAAHAARENMARLTVELASIAAAEQLTKQREADAILEGMGAWRLLSSPATAASAETPR